MFEFSLAILFFTIAWFLKPLFAKEADDWRTKSIYYAFCIVCTPFLGIFIWKFFGGK